MNRLQQCIDKVATLNTEGLKAYRITIGMSSCKRSDKELVWDAIDKRLNRECALVEKGEIDGEAE